jgi:hypothetical protein
MPKGKRTVNKSAFVRGLPDLKASEVVAKAKAQGIVLSDKYVYNIRAKAKARGGKPVGRPGRPGRAKAARGGRSTASAQQDLVDLALEIGLTKAEALLARLRAAVRQAVAG